MGNLFSLSNKSRNNNSRYELFLSTDQSIEQNLINKKMDSAIHLLSVDLKQQMDTQELLISRITRMESRITELQNGTHIALNNVNEKLNEKINEKINIITKDMENLLNNDKILLDKLIEKNIVSTIQEH